MTKVNVTVIEDQEVAFDHLGLPQNRDSFNFELHPSARTRVVDQQTFERFKNFLSGNEDPEWGCILSESWIIFSDLGLKYPNLTPREEAELVAWTELEDISAFESNQQTGLYLIGRALKFRYEQIQRNEPPWKGVIVAASSRGQGILVTDALNAFQNYFNAEGLIIAKESLVEKRPRSRIELGIELFIQNFGRKEPPPPLPPIEQRLWREDTEKWFKYKNPDSLIPHDAPACNIDGKNKLKDYLTNLLTYTPPEEWFEDEQFAYLYKDLQYLFGGVSIAGGEENDEEDKRTLTLGNVALLLAATTADSNKWISSLKWSKSHYQILPIQTKEQAREAILALAKTETGGLFPTLSTHKITGAPLVTKVTLLEEKLTIVFDFDATARDNPEDRNSMSFLEKVRELPPNAGGNAYLAYRRFLIESAKSKDNGRQARCVINVIPDNGKTKMEFVLCQ